MKNLAMIIALTLPSATLAQELTFAQAVEKIEALEKTGEPFDLIDQSDLLIALEDGALLEHDAIEAAKTKALDLLLSMDTTSREGK